MSRSPNLRARTQARAFFRPLPAPSAAGEAQELSRPTSDESARSEEPKGSLDSSEHRPILKGLGEADLRTTSPRRSRVRFLPRAPESVDPQRSEETSEKLVHFPRHVDARPVPRNLLYTRDLHGCQGFSTASEEPQLLTENPMFRDPVSQPAGRPAIRHRAECTSPKTANGPWPAHR